MSFTGRLYYATSATPHILRSRNLTRAKIRSFHGTSTVLHSDPKPSDTEPLMERLKPYISQYQAQYQTTTKYLHELQQTLQTQYLKAKQSIQQANAKLSESSELQNQGQGQTPEQQRLWNKKKLEVYLDSLQDTIQTASKGLNDVTGYSTIQQLRQSIDTLETQLTHSKTQLLESKQKHQTAIKQRSQTQHEINELLQRKSQWTPTDVHHFTQLYTQDHENTLLETETLSRLTEDEAKEAELQDKLSKAILTRYHEEQIWSDKIRKLSTWGTLTLMGVNVLLFLVLQLFLEPWKRKRLVHGFEEKVKDVFESGKEEQESVAQLASLITDDQEEEQEQEEIKEEAIHLPQIAQLSNFSNETSEPTSPLSDSTTLVQPGILITKQELYWSNAISLCLGFSIGGLLMTLIVKS
ncbi:hypothetical protein WICPIJ_000671 [Wickerhamomyces pijperi]|uniref:Sensitive to high expression protein 9, mitochondrial n=1 Tax=Wickerhamomyces pijperi TaxID=599730 RepID=A0A9P8QD58_WICPI|nr:hypothetical protein WICPIJ_000671 [Wickerhamomyces pijperi]